MTGFLLRRDTETKTHGGTTLRNNEGKDLSAAIALKFFLWIVGKPQETKKEYFLWI